MERCGSSYAFAAMGSTILRRFAFVRPIDGNIIAADLIRVAPRLEYLRLDLLSDGHQSADEPAPEGQAPPLPSVAEASIRISHFDPYHYNLEREKNKLGFCQAMCRLLARIPNVVCLHLSGFTTTALLQEKSHEFPTLNQLRTLLLDDCELGPNFYTLSSSILQNTPKLETLGLHRCKEEYNTFLDSTPKRRRTPSKRRGTTAATTLHPCKNLKFIEIKSRQDDVFQILGILSEVFEEMPLAQWRRVDQARDVAGLMTVQFHRTKQGAKLVES
ncbi:MEIOTIC F-BOX protein MOF isoform X1 [Brachypodium distachyon]|uniref:FBD domain-containing protein n=1 Tax=Brachypodium distachyon TaxID=15368 RepID=A0A0Q3JRW1_BRADI|nr:MEIOTIC F-BOX protein MOF isoform X1 [Brachypodium distachyon]KQK14780.1 hypothetical protein BRADI_1g18531v3 [Brachypodium distachyon]|eukprot:XP_003562495.2 MEIOTIC F-BOX protein MOF isoform X1 [Brachypodium distachyon]